MTVDFVVCLYVCFYMVRYVKEGVDVLLRLWSRPVASSSGDPVAGWLQLGGGGIRGSRWSHGITSV